MSVLHLIRTRLVMQAVHQTADPIGQFHIRHRLRAPSSGHVQVNLEERHQAQDCVVDYISAI